VRVRSVWWKSLLQSAFGEGQSLSGVGDLRQQGEVLILERGVVVVRALRVSTKSDRGRILEEEIMMGRIESVNSKPLGTVSILGWLAMNHGVPKDKSYGLAEIGEEENLIILVTDPWSHPQKSE